MRTSLCLLLEGNDWRFICSLLQHRNISRRILCIQYSGWIQLWKEDLAIEDGVLKRSIVWSERLGVLFYFACVSSWSKATQSSITAWQKFLLQMRTSLFTPLRAMCHSLFVHEQNRGLYSLWNHKRFLNDSVDSVTLVPVNFACSYKVSHSSSPSTCTAPTALDSANRFEFNLTRLFFGSQVVVVS